MRLLESQLLERLSDVRMERVGEVSGATRGPWYVRITRVRGRICTHPPTLHPMQPFRGRLARGRVVIGSSAIRAAVDDGVGVLQARSHDVSPAPQSPNGVKKLGVVHSPILTLLFSMRDSGWHCGSQNMRWRQRCSTGRRKMSNATQCD